MKLGNYKGLHVHQPDLTVQDAEVEKVLRDKQHENAVVHNIDDRPADWGDQAVIDFVLRCEGKAVPNGKRHNYPLILGSHTFIKGFEEAIIGHVPGDIFEIATTFPLNYRIENLSGRVGIYKIRLNALRIPEYQEIDDEFARDFSEYETLEEWKAEIRADLEERRRISAEEKVNRDLLDQIIADSRIPIDRRLKKDVFDSLYEDFLFDLEDQGITPEVYCKRSGLTEKQIHEQLMNEAVRAIESESVLHAIIDRENITVSAEEAAREVAAMAAEEGEDSEVFAEMIGEEEMDCILDQLRLEKAMQFVVDQAVFI